MDPDARLQRNTWEHTLIYSRDFTCSQGPHPPGKLVCVRDLRRRIPENSHIPKKKRELGKSLSSQGDSFWSFWTKKCCALRHIIIPRQSSPRHAMINFGINLHSPTLSEDDCSTYYRMTILDVFIFDPDIWVLTWLHESIPGVVYLCVLRYSLHKHLQESLPPPQPAEWRPQEATRQFGQTRLRSQ